MKVPVPAPLLLATCNKPPPQCRNPLYHHGVSPNTCPPDPAWWAPTVAYGHTEPTMTPIDAHGHPGHRSRAVALAVSLFLHDKPSPGRAKVNIYPGPWYLLRGSCLMRPRSWMRLLPQHQCIGRAWGAGGWPLHPLLLWGAGACACAGSSWHCPAALLTELLVQEMGCWVQGAGYGMLATGISPQPIPLPIHAGGCLDTSTCEALAGTQRLGRGRAAAGTRGCGAPHGRAGSASAGAAAPSRRESYLAGPGATGPAGSVSH